MRSPSFHRIFCRSAGLIFGHGPPSNAARAAWTARSTSSTPASATAQIGSSVAGFMVVMVRPEAASTASPLMMSLAGFTGARVSVMTGTSRWFGCRVSLGALFGAPTLDGFRVVQVVGGKPLEHPAQRVLLAPDLRRLLGNALDRLHQLLARGEEQLERIVPRGRAQGRQVLLVHPGLALGIPAFPGGPRAPQRRLHLPQPGAIARDEVKAGLA